MSRYDYRHSRSQIKAESFRTYQDIGRRLSVTIRRVLLALFLQLLGMLRH